METMKKWLMLAAFALHTLCLSGASAKSVPVALTSGTKIKLELATELKSNKSHEGDEVVYYVQQAVLSGKDVLIKKGARATGKVTRAKGAKSFGRKGKLEFTAEEVEAADGSKILLRSTTEKNGKGRGNTVVAVTLLVSVLGVFIKGKNVTVPKATIVDAYVDDDKQVLVSRPDSKPVRRR